MSYSSSPANHDDYSTFGAEKHHLNLAVDLMYGNQRCH